MKTPHPPTFRATILTALVLLAAAAPSPAGAREDIRLQLDTYGLSRFVWRGDMWTDDPVIWQTATVRYGGFRAYNFFNLDLTDINDDRWQVNEYDYILDYTFAFDSFSIAPGVLHFSSPTGFFEPSTKITLEVKVFTLLNPGLRVRIDPTGSKGSYYIASFFQQVPLGLSRVGIDTWGNIGAGEPRYYGKGLSESPAFTDMLLGIGVPVDIGGGFTLSPLVEFTALLGRGLREGIDDRGRPTEAVTWGIVLSRGLTL